jgi:hypothetical protein
VIGGGVSSDDVGARESRGAGPVLSGLRFCDLVRARQSSPLLTPRTGSPNLPLGELDSEVLERLAVEMIKRRPNLRAHFYGRRGQKQHGLDVVERETVDANSVYQIRRCRPAPWPSQ